MLKARDLGFVYKETSAKTGENAKELFELIVESVESPSFSPDGKSAIVVSCDGNVGVDDGVDDNGVHVLVPLSPLLLLLLYFSGSGEQHTVTMVDSERQRNCDLENCCFLA